MLRSPSRGAIAALGLLLLTIFVIWIAVAQAIYVAYFGYEPAASIPHFLDQVFTTPAGRMLMIVGNLVGFLFALGVLTISVISFPLLSSIPRCGRGRSGADIGAGRGEESADDGDLGIDCGGSAVDRLLAAVLHRGRWSFRCSGIRPGTSIARWSSRIANPHQVSSDGRREAAITRRNFRPLCHPETRQPSERCGERRRTRKAEPGESRRDAAGAAHGSRRNVATDAANSQTCVTGCGSGLSCSSS